MRDLLMLAGVLVALGILRLVTAVLDLVDRAEPSAPHSPKPGRPVLRVLPGGLSAKLEVSRG
ncbi:hypothetical protein [Corallococcus coralloides]|uniref:hypothetical protein n=1 Tax=Corallococcus coralloides TaxID=184914 RepID=UPI0002DD4B0E|nr:hypothetical protein [Corallococcus coralloides]